MESVKSKHWCWLFVTVLVLLFSKNSSATITDLKLSTAQIFDVQWSISGGKLNTSGFNYIFASINYDSQTASAARWTAAQTADAGSSGRYIGFFHSTTKPGTYGMAVFNSNGSTYKLINNTGSFRTLADGAIFYNGNGQWGTLITTKQGYTYGQSASFAITQEFPTNQQLETYEPDSTAPLAAGETAPAPEPAAPMLCCGGSAEPFNAESALNNRISSAFAVSDIDNKIVIQQVGNGNAVNIVQHGLGRKHLEININGGSNQVDATQTSNSSLSRNYMEIFINGNNNLVENMQTNTGAKSNSVVVSGNNNQVDIWQKDSGNHYAEIYLSNGAKNVTLTQEGSAAHMARIELSGGATGLTATQSGSTQQFYSITHHCAQTSCADISVTQGTP